MILLMYLIIALSTGITSYIRLYRPAVRLVDEILEYKTIYGGILGSLLWVGIGTLIAPWILLVLFGTDNQSFISNFAAGLIEKQLEDE